MGNESFQIDENLASAMLDCIGDGVISTDYQGRITYINPVAEEIIGWRKAEIIAEKFENVFSVFNSVTEEILESPVARVLSTGLSGGLQNYSCIRSKDGTVKFVSANFAPIKEAQGIITGVVIVFRDITRIKKLEIELTNEKNNLESIFHFAPVAMFILNEESIVGKVNDFALNLFHIKREHIVGKKFGNWFCCYKNPEGDQDSLCSNCELHHALLRVIKENIAIVNLEFQTIFFSNDQQVEFWLEISIAPIVIEETRNVVVAITDITKAKKEEISAIAQRDVCNNLINYFPVPIWQTEVDGICNFVNKRWVDFTGVPLCDVLQNEKVTTIYPDDRETFCEKFEEAFQKKIGFELEHRMRRYDGEYRWVMDIGRPYYNLDGKFSGYVGAIYDITDRKVSEEGLMRYRILSEKTNDIIIFEDMDKRIIDANAAAVKEYGYDYEQLLSLSSDSLLAYGLLDNHLGTLIDCTESIFYETVHKRKDGSTFPVAVSSTSAVIGDKEALVSIVRNETERNNTKNELKKAKIRAEEANKAKSEFLARMSHEIRTPINGMVGMLDLTLLSSLSDEQKENLITAKTCANSLLSLINDILDFSKMEAGKLSVEYVDFNIKNLIEDTIRVHSPDAADKDLALNYTLIPGLPTILNGDPNRLRQILSNLIANAIKFTEKGQVNLTVRLLKNENNAIEVLFTVADTGIGIERQEMHNLFQSFSQVESSLTRKYGGTGLGLVICKQLTNMMGGTIWVNSAPGEGSTFHFTIKFKKSSNISQKQGGVISEEPYPFYVLLVEDDEVNQMVLVRMLEEKGHTVDVVGNGLDAMKKYAIGKYDIIIMDIQMPYMDGVKTIEAIRSQEGNMLHTPIIAVTAYAVKGDRERLLALGADEYISKPIQMNTLFEVINKTMIKHARTGLSVEVDEQGEIFLSKYTPYTTKGEVLYNKEKMQVIQNDLIYLEQLLDYNEYKKIEKCVHMIKFLSDEIHAKNMKNLAFKIELASRRDSIDEIRKYFIDLKEEFLKLHKINKSDGENYENINSGRRSSEQ